MDFTLSEEQTMFAETARTLFTDMSGPEQWRSQMESGAARDQARWTAIVDTGLTLMLLPEAAGGMGLSELDFALIAEAAGAAALPDPLIESAGIAAPMLAALAPDHPALADPAATIAIQHPRNPLIADADTAAALILHRDGQAFVAAPD
ncbi:MAG: acyl-CoA dehydrogenase, partial [Sphingomonadales bacterium]